MNFYDHPHTLLGGSDVERDHMFALLASLIRPSKMFSINLTGRRINAEFERTETTVDGAVELVLDLLHGQQPTSETWVLHIDDASLFVGNRNDSFMKADAWSKLELLLRRGRSSRIIVMLSLPVEQFGEMIDPNFFGYKFLTGSPKDAAQYRVPTRAGAVDPTLSTEWSATPIGKGVDGTNIFIDFEATPHVLLFGLPGSGKTVLSRIVLEHCLKTDWSIYAIQMGTPTVRFNREDMRVASDLEQALSLLEEVLALIQVRYSQMREVDVHTFRKLEDCEPVLMMVDGLDSLLGGDEMGGMPKTSQEKSLQQEAKDILTHISDVGRAVGVHLFLTTSGNYLPLTQILHNINCRIAIGMTDTRIQRQFFPHAAGMKDALRSAERGAGYIETFGLGEAFRAYSVDLDSLR